MIKRSSSRNQRSKGIKVKHVLQIMLLLGVCFWLIYQVKRSHDKKKEFNEGDAKVSVRTQNGYPVPKRGRKVHPGEDKVNQDEKHGEEEEDESIVEDEDKLEHSEHEEEEEEKEDDKPGQEDDNKSEDMEDERGAGDDDIDETDQEKPDVDADRDEEFMDEEKEGGDEKENENNEDEKKEGSVENHNSHEAREENYKGDDASSAVTHDTQTTTAALTENGNSDAIVNAELSITKSDNKPNYTENSNRNQPGSDFKIKEVKLTDETSIASSVTETGNNSVSNPVDNSNLNNISMISFDNHSEASSNLTAVIPGASNNMTVTSTSSEHNKVEMFSESSPAQNDTMSNNITVTEDAKNVQTEGLEQVGNRVSEENLPVSNLTVPVQTENGASNLEGGDINTTTRSVAYNETENKGNSEMSETSKTQNNSYVKEGTGATKDEEFKGNKQTNETSDSSSENGTSDSVEHRAADSHILKDVTEVRIDPDTLPGIRNVGDNGDAAATA